MSVSKLNRPTASAAVTTKTRWAIGVQLVAAVAVAVLSGGVDGPAFVPAVTALITWLISLKVKDTVVEGTLVTDEFGAEYPVLRDD